MKLTCLRTTCFILFFFWTYTAFSATFSIYNNPVGYAGEMTDSESHLQYLNARYYDPATARFISRDTAKLLNRFTYADGNPITNIDPSGHMADLYSSLYPGLMGSLIFPLSAGYKELKTAIGIGWKAASIAPVVSALAYATSAVFQGLAYMQHLNNEESGNGKQPDMSREYLYLSISFSIMAIPIAMSRISTIRKTAEEISEIEKSDAVINDHYFVRQFKLAGRYSKVGFSAVRLIWYPIEVPILLAANSPSSQQSLSFLDIYKNAFYGNLANNISTLLNFSP